MPSEISTSLPSMSSTSSDSIAKTENDFIAPLTSHSSPPNSQGQSSQGQRDERILDALSEEYVIQYEHRPNLWGHSARMNSLDSDPIERNPDAGKWEEITGYTILTMIGIFLIPIILLLLVVWGISECGIYCRDKIKARYGNEHSRLLQILSSQTKPKHTGTVTSAGGAAPPPSVSCSSVAEESEYMPSLEVCLGLLADLDQSTIWKELCQDYPQNLKIGNVNHFADVVCKYAKKAAAEEEVSLLKMCQALQKALEQSLVSQLNALLQNADSDPKSHKKQKHLMKWGGRVDLALSRFSEGKQMGDVEAERIPLMQYHQRINAQLTFSSLGPR